VTTFFREPETFQILRDQVLPRLLKERPPDTPIRVWVAGCATGEEVYSIAMCFLEHAGASTGDSPALQVFATDLSEAALGRARAGIYAESIAQDVSPQRLARFFSRVDSRYQVSRAVRDMCVFARHDLTRDPPFSRLDLISCRNVLIYLEASLQERVLASFHYALKPGGFLLLGASEATSGSSELFAPIDKKHRIYSRRPTLGPTVVGFTRARPVGSAPRRGVVKAAPAEAASREADRLLLARYAPAGVIVDGKDSIVEFRGHVDPYLEHTPGRASLDLFKMARKGLLVGLRQAVQEARKADAPVSKKGLTLPRRGQLHRVDLNVIPLKGSPESEGSLLLLFDERTAAKSGAGRASLGGRRAPSSARTPGCGRNWSKPPGTSRP
jgi:two-component system CheB/CheR fusion protein